MTPQSCRTGELRATASALVLTIWWGLVSRDELAVAVAPYASRFGVSGPATLDHLTELVHGRHPARGHR